MEHVDFDQWRSSFKFQKPIYHIQFDENGNVLGLYPLHEQKDSHDYIEIDDETALQIQEGRISLLSCEVDVLTRTFIVQANKRQTNIEESGPLHRIIEQKYSEDKKYDVFITSKSKKLKFELAKKFGGTKITVEKSLKKILWSKDKEMRFTVTDYNDPHVIYKVIEYKIKDLIGKSIEVDISECPENFSVYTRKIFPNYVILKK